MKLPALAALLLLLPSAIFACLWVEGTTIDGHTAHIRGYDVAAELHKAMVKKPWLESALTKFGKIEKQNDPSKVEAAAVDKIFSGETRAAIEILQGLEAKWPGRYSTAANLGTAYELAGDNENALKWITTGIERNGESHYGTEWLHVLVLKAKIASGKQPLKARLLDIPERLTKDTPINVDGKSYPASSVVEALFHQLSERMVFVKPKDPYVADLLYSYALIQANIDAVESALDLLKMAREYGFSDEALLRQHEQQYQAAVAKATQRR